METTKTTAALRAEFARFRSTTTMSGPAFKKACRDWLWERAVAAEDEAAMVEPDPASWVAVASWVARAA
jgi:hypothetical protein